MADTTPAANSTTGLLFFLTTRMSGGFGMAVVPDKKNYFFQAVEVTKWQFCPVRCSWKAQGGLRGWETEKKLFKGANSSLYPLLLALRLLSSWKKLQKSVMSEATERVGA